MIRLETGLLWRIQWRREVRAHRAVSVVLQQIDLVPHASRAQSRVPVNGPEQCAVTPAPAATSIIKSPETFAPPLEVRVKSNFASAVIPPPGEYVDCA